MPEPSKKSRRWLRRLFVLATLAVLAVAVLGITVLSHLDWIARWSIHRTFPGVTASMDSLRVELPSRLIVKNLELRSSTDREILLRMDSGLAVFRFSELWRARIEDLELDHPNLVISPRLGEALARKPSESAQEPGNPFAWSIASLQIREGRLRVQEFGKGMPTVKMDISANLTDFGVGGEIGDIEHRVELRDIVANSPSDEKVAAIDRITVAFTTDGLFTESHIDSIGIGTGNAEITPELFDLPGSGKSSASSGKGWTIGSVSIGSLAIHVADLPGQMGALRFDLSAQLREVGSSGTSEGTGEQAVALRDVRLETESPHAPPILTADSATASFSIEQLVQHHVSEVVLENPAVDFTVAANPEERSGPAGEDGKPVQWIIDHVLCKYGTLTVRGLRDGAATVRAKFAFEASDFGTLGDAARKAQRLTLWDIDLLGEVPRPIIDLDLIRVEFTPDGLLSDHHIDTVTIEGGRLRVGNDLRSLLPGGDSAASSKDASTDSDGWTIGTLRVSNVRSRLEDDRPGLTELRFTLNTELRDVSTSGLSGKLLDEVQLVEFADIVLHSPIDRSTRILSLRSVFVRFTLRDLAAKHLREIVILRPTIYLNQDLFVYMERATAADESEGPSPQGTAPGEPQWSVEHLEVKFGKLVLGSGATSDVGLPLEFETIVDNIALDNLASLQVQGALTVPRQSYENRDYQISIENVQGDLRFSYPPEKGEQNLVQKLDIEAVRWRQYETTEAWIAATFDVNGINGTFGGAAYAGYLNGGFSFFFTGESPWIGWITGTGVDTSAVTEIISPQNFTMTGPLDFDIQVDAFRKDIERLRGNFRITEPGSFRIGKLDDLIARIPETWTSLKQDSTRIALETLRDFEYTDATGEFWFVQSQGILNVDLSGPNGSRDFEIVLHDGQETDNPWQQGKLGKN